MATTGGDGRRSVRRLQGTSYGRHFELTVPATLYAAVVARLVGVRWDVDGGEPEASWRVRHRPGAGWQAMRDGRPLSGAEGPDDAVERLVRDLERWIAEDAPDAVFLDAGVVTWRGRAIVLPGHRLPGRTTLVATLVRAGASYLSDLYAVLDRDGRVHPYPRPLPLNRPRPGERPSYAIGPAPGTPPAEVGMIARLAYHPAAPRTERLTRGQATLALIDAAIPGHRRAAEVSAVAAAAARNAVGIAGTRGDASLTARQLLERLDAAFPVSARAAGHERRGQEARAAPHSSSRIEWTTESRHSPRTKT